ncbi:MAG: DUF5340 domain-containing protein [Okeania sp. SIO3H1]|uniref:DUF5340 domain-containing protein n=1 Tax=Okeania sp. SIO1I7 TaxID=2607772 RepID=UPI0013C93645|nr:DUF5340 domain-containing protein [Okeania sp. SIO1I7]NEN89272.1 DUF5340 domain-containing protein [Okeania sp. SIO3H1]NET24543.1 DUF5340 domain-containing protein [Okeania sp. SIO1I7]
MEAIPVPSRIHYELLLQLLEKKTILAVDYNTKQHEKVRELIVTVRKALALQKQFEESCKQANLPIEYQWSLNETEK